MKDKLEVRKEVNEVTVLVDGSTLISQRKLAKLLNVNRSTLSMRIGKQNYSSSNGLDEETAFALSTYFAYESKVATQEARDFLAKLGTGGMRAFNYSEAGYKLQAVTKAPTALELAIADVERAKDTVKLLEKVEALSIQAEEDAVLTAKSDEWFPVSHARRLNPNIKVDGRMLTKLSIELGLEVRQLYSNYDGVTTNTYHYDVWVSLYPSITL